MRFIQAYEAAGIPTDYVSMQNEPLYEPDDYPGMRVLPDQEAAFIGGHLGPALRRAGLDHTAILGYDDNWDITDYPEFLYHDRRAARYVAGTAWHCYAGKASAQSVSHNGYPHAQAFLTECSGGTWQGAQKEAFGLTMDTVIGGPRNWGQSVILWNLVLDQRDGPFIGGCRTCRGVVTVNTDTGQGEQEPGLLGARPRQQVRPAGGSPDRLVRAGIAGRQRRLPQPRRVAGADRAQPRPPGPAGTPAGRLASSVGPEVIAAMSQVELGGRWLAYGLPFGVELQPSGLVTTLDRDDWRPRADGVTRPRVTR